MRAFPVVTMDALGKQNEWLTYKFAGMLILKFCPFTISTIVIYEFSAVEKFIKTFPSFIWTLLPPPEIPSSASPALSPGS